MPRLCALATGDVEVAGNRASRTRLRPRVDRGCARGCPCPAISPDVSPDGAAPKKRVTRNTTDPDSPDMPSTPQPIAAKSYNASGAIQWQGFKLTGEPGC